MTRIDRCGGSAPGEVPLDGGTALQEDARPPGLQRQRARTTTSASSAATCSPPAMDPEYMTKRVRVKCGRCRTINVAVTDESPAGDPRQQRARALA